MEKFTSQQAALRSALTQVMGTEPTKGQLVISDEQRAQVGALMVGWLDDGLWSIREGTRAHGNPLAYITGKQPTCLIQAWVNPRKKEGSAEASGDDKLQQIKQALDAGLITQEQAQQAAMKHLGLAS